VQVTHDREQYRRYLERLPSGSQIALEASGHYYWIVDEMEAAGHYPRLGHPLEAKKRMGKPGKKTDKVDANGLGILLRNGTLPEVWIPPAGLRDQRELLRLRMFLVQQRTRLKNRIQGALARYNIQIGGDVFSVEGRLRLSARLGELPPHTRQSVQLELVTMDFMEMQIEEVEQLLQGLMDDTVEADLLKTLPYVGRILSMVMTLEIGRVERFASAEHLASYAGLVPRVHSSGGRTRLGQICGDVNRYLKWAFIEAGNLVVIHQKQLAGRHVVRCINE
jgi:transposase